MPKTTQVMREDRYDLFTSWPLPINFASHVNSCLHLRTSPQEIYPEDIKLAVKMNDACAVGVDARGSVANKVRDQLQKKSLTELADPRSVQNRYPAEMFMQRSHTYVPGGEVYLEVSTY